MDSVRDVKPVKDAKTGLQEWLQGKHLPLAEYKVKRVEGESHRQIFHVECEVVTLGIRADGSGLSRRLAEQEAAAHALVTLTQQRADAPLASGNKHDR